MNFAQHLYRIHVKTKIPDRIEYFNKFSLFTEILFKLMAFIYASGTSTLFLYPLYMYFVMGELVPSVACYLPFVNEKTISGYTITMIYQITCFICALIGFSAHEFFISITMINSLMFSKLIGADLEQLNLHLDDDKSIVNTLRRFGYFRNILMMYQDMDE